MTLIDMEVLELPEHQQIRYRQLVDSGESPRMALMLASRSGPVMGGSDRTFNEGQRQQMLHNHPESERHMLKIAQKAGISTHGKYYVGQLGKYDDPMAWVSSVDDVKEVAKTKNLNVHGLIKHKAKEVPPPPPVPLAADLKRRYVNEELQAEAARKGNPRTETEARRRYREVSERVVAERGNQKRGSLP